MLKLKPRKLIDEMSARVGHRITIEEASEAVGYSTKTVSLAYAYEGTDSFTGKQLEAWCDYLGCQPGDILERNYILDKPNEICYTE